MRRSYNSRQGRRHEVLIGSGRIRTPKTTIPNFYFLLRFWLHNFQDVGKCKIVRSKKKDAETLKFPGDVPR